MKSIELPINVHTDHSGTFFDTSEYPEDVFSYPFLSRGLDYYRNIKRHVVRKSYSLNQILAKQEREGAIEPSGFIFHMSRCGSTLISQMLDVVDQFRVVAEPPAINRYLSSLSDEGSIFCASTFCTLVKAYAPTKDSEKQHFFIKLSSWNSCYLNHILSAFPDAPWIFVVRNPVDVLISNHKKPSGIVSLYQKHPDEISSFLDINDDVLSLDHPSTFLSSLFSVYFRNVLKHISNKGLIICYENLPESIITQILPHFGIAISAKNRKDMLLRSKYYSKGKDSKELFVPENHKITDDAFHEMNVAFEKNTSHLWNQLTSFD